MSNSRDATLTDITYGSGADFPVFASLDTKSSYFRMVHSKTAGFATSFVLLPIVWSNTSACPLGGLCQGAKVSVAYERVGPNLRLTMVGTIAKNLRSTVKVTLSPPVRGHIRADVVVRNEGDIALNTARGAETFKAVFLSSMKVGPARWDAKTAFAGPRSNIQFVEGNLLTPAPGYSAAVWGVNGGSNAWKTNASTVEVRSGTIPCSVNGYVTPSANPNDDNIGMWCGSSKLLRSYSYSVTYRAA